MLANTDNIVEIHPLSFGRKSTEPRPIESVSMPTLDVATVEREPTTIDSGDILSKLRVGPAERTGFRHVADAIVLLSLVAAGTLSIAFVGTMAIDAYSELMTFSPASLMRVLGGAP